MNKLEFEHLKRLCEAATPGPIIRDGVYINKGTFEVCGTALEADAKFIEASWTALSELIAMVETLERQLENESGVSSQIKEDAFELDRIEEILDSMDIYTGDAKADVLKLIATVKKNEDTINLLENDLSGEDNRIYRENQQLIAMVEDLTAERDELSERRDPITEAFDECSRLIDGDTEWEYPAQMIRTVQSVIDQRDKAKARVAKLEDLEKGLICVFCKGHAQGNHCIHRDGFSEGPEVPLCDKCGGLSTPTCEEIWEQLASERSPVSVEKSTC